MPKTDNDGLHEKHGSYPPASTVGEFQHNIAAIRERISIACARVGRNPSDVRLLPVSKTFSEENIRMANAAGCNILGENKVQEAYKKWESLIDLDDLQWSIIGHLQTNKAKLVARFASEFHALDSLRLAEALDKHLQKQGRELAVFIQVNTSGESSKYGLAPEEVAGFLRAMPAYSSLNVKGLMTLALFTDDQKRVRECFSSLKAIRDKMRQEKNIALTLDELSMGMSGDFEIAIEEGSTLVRIGQAIFGSRNVPDSHYWPSA